MTDLLTAGVSTLGSSTTQATASDTTTEISSDFQTFLRMLTAQLENQDPLNPLDSTDFAMQLATFSGVEQQVQTNDLLESLADQLGQGSLSNVASWVGMEALTTAPVSFSGGANDLELQHPENAVASLLRVYDAEGALVSQISLLPSETQINWDGVSSVTGEVLPSGSYSFLLSGYDAQGGQTSLGEVRSYSRIREVRPDGDDTTLILQGGAQISAADIQALRSSDASGD